MFGELRLTVPMRQWRLNYAFAKNADKQRSKPRRGGEMIAQHAGVILAGVLGRLQQEPRAPSGATQLQTPRLRCAPLGMTHQKEVRTAQMKLPSFKECKP